MKCIRRITALLTVLLMLSAVLPALAQTASGAVITMNGVRTAFFDPQGRYLPPSSRTGCFMCPPRPSARAWASNTG